MMFRTGCIYALCDPDGTPRYVGKTVQSPKARRGDHIREAVQRERQSEVHDWIRRLVSEGSGPTVWVLEEDVEEPDLFIRERHWIAAMKTWGYTLLNYTSGGNGCGTLSPTRIRNLQKFVTFRDRCPKGRFLPVETGTLR